MCALPYVNYATAALLTLPPNTLPVTHVSALHSLSRPQGLVVEADPYPSPLDVAPDQARTVVRWNDVAQGSGIYCYRIRVLQALPMPFLLSHEFTAAVSRSPNVEDFVAVPLVEYVVEYKWESWGWWATLINGATFCLYLATTTATMLWICSDSKVFDESSLQRTPLFILCVAFSLFFNSVLMSMATWQFAMSSKWEFFKSFWNVSDLVMIVLCHVSLILGTAFGPTHVNRILCTLLSLIIWSRTLYFGRGSAGLSSLIDAIKHILFDMRYFILILTLFLAAFAVAFRVLGVFDSLFFSFILCFNMMLGDVSFYYVRGHVVAQMLYVTFLVSVAIILLNSLIALMEHSLQKATKRKHIATLVSRITLLKELEFKMAPLTWFIQTLRQTFGNYKDSGDLVILVPELLGKPDLSTPSSERQILKGIAAAVTGVSAEVQEIRSSAKASNSQLEARMDSVEAKIHGIDAKLDRVLALLASGFAGERTVDSLFSSPAPSFSLLDLPLSGVPGRDGGEGEGEQVITYTYFGAEEKDDRE